MRLIYDMPKLIILAEKFWHLVSKVRKIEMDDQIRINTALTKMDLHWNEVMFMDDKTWMGRNGNGFTVSILKSRHICRLDACIIEQKSNMYVWHHGGTHSEGKLENAELDGTWFLRDDWMIAQNSSAVGVEWLQEIVNRTNTE